MTSHTSEVEGTAPSYLGREGLRDSVASPSMPYTSPSDTALSAGRMHTEALLPKQEVPGGEPLSPRPASFLQRLVALLLWLLKCLGPPVC